ncbi:MAG: type secretory pathway, component PulF [Cytophagaceae bacterium]|jgi:type IV pilus assembly protein PilC|nr:type secretory pathway, component PulF [Cytophagaceae bacterium]
MAVDLSKIGDKVKKQQPNDSNKETKGMFDFLNKDIQLFGSGLSDKKKEAFYHEFTILLTAGVDIRSVLDLIAMEQTSPKDKELFESLKQKIIDGSTLSDAIRDSGKFSPYEFFSIQIGEESGKLPLVLKELAEYYQTNIKLRRQVVSALTYPSIVLFTSFGAIFFMLNFIVPMFADIFKRFGGDLPYITALIVRLSDMLSDYFYLIVLFFVTIFVFVYTQRRKIWFRDYSVRIILKIPLIGEIIRKIYLARFCHSMALLIGSKIPILRAIGLVKQMIGFYPIEISLTKIETDIVQGVALNKSLSEFDIYPRRMISLVKVGEEVNQLESFFGKIAKQYTEDVEHQTGLISSMLEPVMIIFLGVIVGVILIAMYLPLFQLSTTF